MRIAILVLVASFLLVGRAKLAETNTANYVSKRILALASEFLTVWREFATVSREFVVAPTGIAALTVIGTYGDPRDGSLPRRPLNTDFPSYRDPVSGAACYLHCVDNLVERTLHSLYVPNPQRERP